MKKTLNKYGDRLIKTSGTHGADISSQRMDDLDKKALEYVFKNYDKNLKGIDAGCGFGIQSTRFALLNAEMYLFDILNIKQRIDAVAKKLFIEDKLIYRRKSIMQLSAADLPESADFFYSQRFIHYLTYADAHRFISTITNIIKPKGLFFISASGLHSELGVKYKGNNIGIEKRYFRLSPNMAAKHNILEKVCLYSKADFYNLLQSNKLKVREIRESSFGNIKAIAVKP